MVPFKSPFKNPHIEERKIGDLPVNFHYKIPKEIPRTAVAFSELAKVENRDQVAQEGDENYVASLQKLMDAFDVFIREKFRKKPANIKNNPSNNEEFTIILLWQIRHILTHNGGMVDEISKGRYEKIIQEHKEMQQLVDLPLELEIGKQFTIDSSNYTKARECILGYVQKHVSPEDFQIIRSRASIVIMPPEGTAVIPLNEGHIIFDIAEATRNGFILDNWDKIPPKNTTYNLKEQRIYLENGSSFPAKFIPDKKVVN